MQLSEFIRIVNKECLNHILVNNAYYGDVYKNLNSGKQVYPVTNLTIESVNEDTDNDLMTFNGTLIYVDMLTNDSSNKIDVQSAGITILSQILDRLVNVNLGWSTTQRNYTIFTEKFADLCGGAFVNFSMSVHIDKICDDRTWINE